VYFIVIRPRWLSDFYWPWPWYGKVSE